MKEEKGYRGTAGHPLLVLPSLPAVHKTLKVTVLATLTTTKPLSSVSTSLGTRSFLGKPPGSTCLLGLCLLLEKQQNMMQGR